VEYILLLQFLLHTAYMKGYISFWALSKTSDINFDCMWSLSKMFCYAKIHNTILGKIKYNFEGEFLENVYFFQG